MALRRGPCPEKGRPGVRKPRSYSGKPLQRRCEEHPQRTQPDYHRSRSPPHQLPRSQPRQHQPHRHPQHQHLSPSPLSAPPLAPPMERTPSGNSVIIDYNFSPPWQINTLTPPALSDREAASRVHSHFKRLKPHSQHERMLRYLIHSTAPITDATLADILVAANAVFFAGLLARRVTWEWLSHDRYRHEIIAATALRASSQTPGYETLILLSEPILNDPAYGRRLLLSAFLHELIHCYLFIQCGPEARTAGGHTPGFEEIAGLIDGWAGEGVLLLRHMKANLAQWRELVERGRRRSCCGGVEPHLGCDDTLMKYERPRPVEYYDDAGFVRSYEV